MIGQLLLTHFSTQCVSFPAFLPEVLDLGLPLSSVVLPSSVGVPCDLVFALIPLHILIFAHVFLSQGHIFFLFAWSKLLLCIQSLKSLSSLSVNSDIPSCGISPNSGCALGICLVLPASLVHQDLPDLSQHNPISPYLSVYSSPRPLCLTCFLFLSLSLSLLLSPLLSFSSPHFPWLFPLFLLLFLLSLSPAPISP